LKKTRQPRGSSPLTRTPTELVLPDIRNQLSKDFDDVLRARERIQRGMKKAQVVLGDGSDEDVENIEP
jgi:hypothetical protein